MLLKAVVNAFLNFTFKLGLHYSRIIAKQIFDYSHKLIFLFLLYMA